MGVESTSCSKCGKILRYNAGLFGNYPQSDGLFSRLCSECANDRREEERHEERLKASKRRDAELEQDRNSRYEDSERRLEEDREEQRRRHEELEQQAEDAAYEAQNPGDYECPCCFFITLRSGASRCPKCQGSISGEYWNKIYEQEAVEEKIAQEKFQEWERLEPFRDAEEAREKWVTAKDEVATNWLLFTGIFLTGILVFGLYRLFYTIPASSAKTVGGIHCLSAAKRREPLESCPQQAASRMGH